VNSGESVCTIGLYYVVKKIILPSKFNVKLFKKFGGWGSRNLGQGGSNFFRGGGDEPP
jgi:hypothetical protein